MKFTVFLLVTLISSLFEAHAFKLTQLELEDRIVGGVEIDIQDAPWQVSLQANKNHRCGGSIIGSNFVLTAGHCTKGFAVKDLSVRVGSQRHAKDGQIVGVESVYVHDNYDSRYIDYDYSLLKLDTQLNFTDFIQPIALPNDDDDDIPDDEMCIISGWGKTMDSSQSTQKLRAAKVPIVNQKICIERYRSINAVTPRMICAGFDEGGKDSCQGDSGGPLSCIDPADGVRKVYGIVSWGYGCAQAKYPGVYARVSAAREWINEYTGF